MAAALTTNQTFSGVTTHWPADGSDERLAVDLSGLPVFDAERNVQGHRGFGICRDTALIASSRSCVRGPRSGSGR